LSIAAYQPGCCKERKELTPIELPDPLGVADVVAAVVDPLGVPVRPVTAGERIRVVRLGRQNDFGVPKEAGSPLENPGRSVEQPI
jgi:hypothetical protein